MRKETERVEREDDIYNRNFIYFIILLLFEGFPKPNDSAVSIPKKLHREERDVLSYSKEIALQFELHCPAITTDLTSLESQNCWQVDGPHFRVM